MSQDATSFNFNEDFLSPGPPFVPQLYPTPQAQGMCCIPPNTDASAAGISSLSWTYGMPMPPSWFPSYPFSLGFTNPGLTLSNHPYAFLPFMNPASISFGAPNITSDPCGANQAKEPTFQSISHSPLNTVASPPSQDCRSLVVEKEPLDVWLDGCDGTSVSPVTRTPTPEPPRYFDGTSAGHYREGTSDYSLTSSPQESAQALEYIDLTGDDVSDGDHSDLCVPDTHAETMTTDEVREESKSRGSPQKYNRSRRASKRQRDGEDDARSSSSLGNGQKRRCMRTAPRRPAQGDELILDVRAILFTDDSGQEVESKLESGRWTLPFHQDDITAFNFSVNSGNLTKLTFCKIEANDTEGGWWMSDDIDGCYIVFLSGCDIISLIENPKAACYQEYLFLHY